jgi:hypothetical protein
MSRGRSSASSRAGSLAQVESKVGMPGSGHLFSSDPPAIACSSFSSSSLCRQISWIFFGILLSGGLGRE